MGLNIFKLSRHNGNSVDLIKFVYGEGAGDVFCYTTAERSVEHAGETYAPIAIKRGNFRQTARGKGVEMQITVAKDSPIAELFQGAAPRRMVGVQVFEGDLAEPDGPASLVGMNFVSEIYAGRVLEARHTSRETTLTCDDYGFGLRRPGLFRFYQRTCGHVLYGARCGASKEDATFELTVTDYQPTDRMVWLNLNTIDAQARDRLVGGTLEWTGPRGFETRVITSVNPSFLYVDTTVAGSLNLGDTVNVVYGCPRTLAGCGDIHGNLVNFGGTPFINEKNPEHKNNHT